MAINRTPVLKRCRSLGLEPSYLGVAKSSRRKNMRAQRKVSEYGLQLREKQKAKFIYGVQEKPFRNMYEKAERMQGLVGENLMQMLELRLDNIDEYNVGDEIKADVFQAGDFVDVQGISKGKGFQGVIKRHGQHIGPKGHGSMYHRRPGSMGPTSSPGRVFPGKNLPGHTGKDTVTVQHLEVVRVDMDKNVILIKGSIPGYKNSLVRIKDSVKSAK